MAKDLLAPTGPIGEEATFAKAVVGVWRAVDCFCRKLGVIILALTQGDETKMRALEIAPLLSKRYDDLLEIVSEYGGLEDLHSKALQLYAHLLLKAATSEMFLLRDNSFHEVHDKRLYECVVHRGTPHWLDGACPEFCVRGIT